MSTSTPELNIQDQTTLSTLHLLESRLHRLTYLLTGDSNWTGTPNPPQKPASYEETVARRLQNLERKLLLLSEKEGGGVVKDILAIYDRFPELFKPSSSLATPSNPNPNAQSPDTNDTDVPSVSPTHESPSLDQAIDNLNPPLEIQKSTILAYATTLPELASRLTSLTDTPIPDAELSAALINLQPRMGVLSKVQEEQAREISELRVRSANAVKRFYELGVLGAGEVWGEWEGRVEGVERGVRRGEVAVARGRE
ncbi:hypothetical protein BJY04DRAFT_215606 [Aspergillus karnatakaensis]|uniref:putative nuclear distribution protein RO10 n=1 Tax=Aspergillus karnatakaensis TaxID=1810916 RepID=UPI003CCCC949